MWFPATVPKTKRFVSGFFFEEVRQICRIVYRRYGFCGWICLSTSILFAGKLTRLTVMFARVTRPPTFAGKTYMVALQGQHFHERTIIGREVRVVVGRGTQLPGVSTGKDSG